MTAPALTPEELDEACRLAGERLDFVAHFRKHQPHAQEITEWMDAHAFTRIAVALLALRDERDRLREQCGAERSSREDYTAFAIAAYVKPTGEQAPTCCDACARRWEILRNLADEIRAGCWRPTTAQPSTPETPAAGTEET